MAPENGADLAMQFDDRTLATRQMLTLLADAQAKTQSDGVKAWEVEVGRRLGSLYTTPLDLLITVALELRNAAEELSAAIQDTGGSSAPARAA